MLKARSIWALALAILLLITAHPALALSGGGEQTLALGNTPINSLNGGQMATYGNTFFWADHTGIYGGERLLSEEPGRHLNVINGGLYFTVEDGPTLLRRFDLDSRKTETVLIWESPIDQLYITCGNLALLLSAGRVYEVRLSDQATTVRSTGLSVTRFIPTVYGTIYATGSLGNFTLYAEGRLIEAGVTQFFTEDDDLIIRRGADDYQVAFRNLFSGRALDIQAYEPREDTEALALLASAETDPEDDPADIVLFGAEAMEAQLANCTFPVNIVPYSTTHGLALTQNQINIVLRARQQLEIRWTPLRDITGWRGNTTFRAGQTYTGIPYGQPVSAGHYVPWTASLDHFADAVADLNSNMYTRFSFNGTHATRAPFYASDCSAFVSWSLNHPHRTHTGTFPNFATRITRELGALQVGDVMNAPSHSILITAVEFDGNGNLAAIETMEQTSPLPRHRRYGAGGDSGGLAVLMQRANASGYHFYRSNITYVPFVPSPAVDVGLGVRHVVTAISGPGGTISPYGLVYVPDGGDQTFTFHPQQGHSVLRVLVNGVDVGDLDSYTLTDVTEDARIEVEFHITGNPFLDVAPNNWFYDPISYVFQEGLMLGISTTQFSPHAYTTRGMFVTILGRMAGVHPDDWATPGTVASVVNIRSGPGTRYAIVGAVTPDTVLEIIGISGNWYRITYGGSPAYVSRDFVTTESRAFTDVIPGRFYAPFVEWAYYMDVTTGTGYGRFSPDTTITRQEMATLLYRYITVMEIELPVNEAEPFHDLEQIAEWAWVAVTALQQADILRGTGAGFFEPLGTSNRASVASMIANFHQLQQATDTP
ncbi:MAG: S-layer homology domain-containing protein [Oscillospiraceae bacterium]|nr:S-layer homology domain-containing protein [Oscillospiraceae bacterium]